MSSLYVRDQIKAFLTTQFPTETVLDITAQYGSISNFLLKNGVGKTDEWTGLQFVGSDEIPISTGSVDKGCYREIGTIFLHVVAPIHPDIATNLIARAEVFREGLRGQRIGSITIESVTPPNTDLGATLEFEEGYSSATVNISYQRDLNL